MARPGYRFGLRQVVLLISSSFRNQTLDFNDTERVVEAVRQIIYDTRVGALLVYNSPNGFPDGVIKTPPHYEC